MLRRLRTSGLLSAGLVALPLMLLASVSKADGVLNAVSYFPIEPSSTFHVRTLDNSEENLRLIESMKQALRLNGRGVDDDARLILTVEPTDEIGSLQSSDRYIMSITGESAPAQEDNAQLRLNLFDSQSGGLLNEGESGNSVVNPSEYALLVRVEDSENGRQLWEGWATSALYGGDSNALLAKMVGPLADAIGETISQQPFYTE